MNPCPCFTNAASAVINGTTNKYLYEHATKRDTEMDLHRYTVEPVLGNQFAEDQHVVKV
jgi:hypothetical protein